MLGLQARWSAPVLRIGVGSDPGGGRRDETDASRRPTRASRTQRVLEQHDELPRVRRFGQDHMLLGRDAGQPGTHRVLRFRKRPQFELKTDNIPMVAAQYESHFVFVDNNQMIFDTNW